MEYIVDIKEDRKQLELRVIRNDDISEFRQMFRGICSRVAGRQFTVDRIVEILIEELRRFTKQLDYNASLQRGVMTRVKEFIDDLVWDPKNPDLSRRLAKAIKDHFREELITKDI